MAIPAKPESVQDIDTTSPFFSLPRGENITKLDVTVEGDPDRRLLGLSSNKVMEAATRMSKKCVIDETFKLSNRIE